MNNFGVFCKVCLVIVLGYAYGASVQRNWDLTDTEVDPAVSIDELINKMFSGPSNSNMDQNTEVDPTVPIEEANLSKDDAEQILDELGYNATTNDEETFGTRSSWGANYDIFGYQRYYGLDLTGELDAATKTSLKMPRCGVSDIAAQGEDYKWSKHSLKYYVRNFPSGVSPATVKRLLRKAFDEWSKVTNLEFFESDNPQADIDILFGGRRHQDRGGTCEHQFNDNTLAHAHYPERGTIHFNTKFFFGSKNEVAFFNTAVHEIGHALGLDHSTSKASIMFPTQIAQFSALPQIDAEKIQSKYGRRRVSNTGKSQRGKSAPGFCGLSKYDAMLYDHNSQLLVIAGKYCYTNVNSDAQAALISEKWPGAPDSIDAAFTGSSHSYLFSGENVWAFDHGELVPGYPRMIRNAFPGLPKNLDAIAKYKNKYIFAFKDGHFWRYNMDVKYVDHSGEVAYFGIPSHIDAAVFDSSAHKIFFYRGGPSVLMTKQRRNTIIRG